MVIGPIKLTPQKLSDQYLPVAEIPPENRTGTVKAFNTAFQHLGGQGPHWSKYQYSPDPDVSSIEARLKPVTKRDREQISAMSKAHSQTTDTVSILDFGAGDGRLNGLYEQIGNELSSSGKKLEVLALDTSIEGLSQFAIKLMQAGFIGSAKEVKLNAENKGYLFGTFTKGNLTVKLIHGDINNSPDDVRKLVLENNDGKNVSLTFSFDTLPFIEGQENRAAFLKMFREITDADLLVTVPGMNTEKWQPLLNEFKQRRDSGGSVGLAKEKNSFMFNFQGHHALYKLFERMELAVDAIKAGLENFAIRVNQMWHPARHKEDGTLEVIDRECTDSVNRDVDLEGHDSSLDRIFHTVDGFIQLHHKPSAK